MKKSTLAMKPKDQSDWGNGNQDLRQTLDKTAQPKTLRLTNERDAEH